MAKKKEDVKEVKEEQKEKKDSDLILSRLDVQAHEEREPKETKGGINNMFTIITY